MSQHLKFAALVLLAALASPVPAADICELGDTIDQCWQRVTGSPDVEVAKAQVSEDVKKEETGLDGGAAALATTTRNLLPFLAASGLVADSDGNSEDQLFTLDLNFLIRGISQDNNAQLKAILNTKPALFDDVKTAFDDATGDDARSKELQDGLSAADDYTFSFTYNHVSDRFGRAPKQQQARFARLFDAAVSAATAEESRGGARDPALVMAGVLQRVGIDDKDFVLTDEALLTAVENAAKFDMSLGSRTRGKVLNFQLPRFAELVNNQPQLAFTAELHDRDPLVGAKEKAIKFTYEFGFASVNDFVDEAGAQCGIGSRGLTALASVDANACLTAYSRYVSSHDKALANADRFSIELSYVEVEDYEFASEDDGIELARDGTRHLDIAVGYGRTVQALGADRDSRVDLVAKYEDYSDDVEHQDRLVATLTFTTQLNGVAIPFSLVYANHQKFLPESDDTLGAHIGIKYQFDPQD
jgi:hypothetical protein